MIRMSLKSKDKCPCKRHTEERRGEGPVRGAGKFAEGRCQEPEKAWDHQTLEEVGRGPSLVPSEGAQPCHPLDFGLLAS